MKIFISTLLIAVLTIVVANAQQISVVSNGVTSLHRSLQEAIEEADPGSFIYLPGGNFPIDDSVKITKPLNIIGIGHYAKNSGNVDGWTTISGNLFFNQGSSGSSVLGCYITNVTIGEGGASVNNVLIRYCNLNWLSVSNATCLGTVVNQNYIRGGSSFGNTTDVTITNNVINYIRGLEGGIIENNIITGAAYLGSYAQYIFYNCNNCWITDNIFLSSYDLHPGNESQVYGNMKMQGLGEDNIKIEAEWKDVFVNYNGGKVSPASDFHFKDAYKQYENSVGVYADGVQFDKQLPPAPYIVAKRVDEETDASGMLNIKIRVKAGE